MVIFIPSVFSNIYIPPIADVSKNQSVDTQLGCSGELKTIIPLRKSIDQNGSVPVALNERPALIESGRRLFSHVATTGIFQVDIDMCSGAGSSDCGVFLCDEITATIATIRNNHTIINKAHFLEKKHDLDFDPIYIM